MLHCSQILIGSILSNPYNCTKVRCLCTLPVVTLLPTYIHLTGRQRLSGLNKHKIFMSKTNIQQMLKVTCANLPSCGYISQYTFLLSTVRLITDKLASCIHIYTTERFLNEKRETQIQPTIW